MMTSPQGRGTRMARGVLFLAIGALAGSVGAASGQVADPLRKALPNERPGEASETIAGTGTIVAHKTSSLGPLVEGRIENIHVNVGDRVEAGAPLFQTRSEIFKLKVDEAKAAVAVAEARLRQAELAWGRIGPLAERGVTSQANRDIALSAANVAKAEVEAARARLHQAEQDLADTVVRAPFRAAVTVDR